MIKATFTRGNEEIVLKVEGHAGQADKGHDIVCSAASILTYTIAQYLQYINEQGGLQKKPHIILNDGNALIVAKPNSEYEAEVLNAFFVAEVGFSLLAHNYPQFVELNVFGKAE